MKVALPSFVALLVFLMRSDADSKFITAEQATVNLDALVCLYNLNTFG